MLHLGPIWYHSEPSDAPYSQNLPRPISWFGLFSQQNDSSLKYWNSYPKWLGRMFKELNIFHMSTYTSSKPSSCYICLSFYPSCIFWCYLYPYSCHRRILDPNEIIKYVKIYMDQIAHIYFINRRSFTQSHKFSNKNYFLFAWRDSKKSLRCK